MNRSMGIYIHIPFCVKKCNYCDFLSSPAGSDIQKRYLNALCREIRLQADNLREQANVCSVFIGGGTPSIWPGEWICSVMEALRKSFNLEEDAEITIECNPGTLSEDKLTAYRSCGINRLSIGLQSTDNDILKKLGRIHTYEEFSENFILARKAGFKNINVDLMSALPGQTLSGFLDTLRKVIALNPEHISAYSLIVEEGTPFYSEKLELPDEDTERDMYHMTKEMLKAAGYERYEISNYSRSGYESRHNKLYWTGRDYLGIGLGASSLVCGKRFSNIRGLSDYLEILENSPDDMVIKRIVTDEHLQTEKDRMEEYCFLGLRLMEGISISEFKESFNKDFFDVYGETVGKYKEMGLIITEGDRIRLSDAGIDVSNVILADFLVE